MSRRVISRMLFAVAALAILSAPALASPAHLQLRGTIKIVEDGRPASGGDAGRFKMTGALSDAGTLRTNFVSAKGNVVHLRRQLVGAKGKIVFNLAITSNGTNVGPITGVWSIVSGTGAYAGLHGKGTSKGVLKANNAGYHEVATGTISR